MARSQSQLSTLFNFLFHYPLGRVTPFLLSDLSLLWDYSKPFPGIIRELTALREERSKAPGAEAE